MEAEKTPRQIARFGIFDLDVGARSLHKSGIRIKLQAQPFDILVSLISKRGEVVTRDELQRNLWPSDTFVDFAIGSSRRWNGRQRSPHCPCRRRGRSRKRQSQREEFAFYTPGPLV